MRVPSPYTDKQQGRVEMILITASLGKGGPNFNHTDEYAIPK